MSKKEMIELKLKWSAKNLRKVLNKVTPSEFIGAFGILTSEQTRNLIYSRSEGFGTLRTGKTIFDLVFDGDLDEDWLYMLDIPFTLTHAASFKRIEYPIWVFKNKDTWLKQREKLAKEKGRKEKYERWENKGENKLKLNVRLWLDQVASNLTTDEDIELFREFIKNNKVDFEQKWLRFDLKEKVKLDKERLKLRLRRDNGLIFEYYYDEDLFFKGETEEFKEYCLEMFDIHLVPKCGNYFITDEQLKQEIKRLIYLEKELIPYLKD